MIRVTRTIRDYWRGELERLNSVIYAAQAKARGYRTTRNLIIMTYLIGGKFDFPLPELTHTK